MTAPDPDPVVAALEAAKQYLDICDCPSGWGPCAHDLIDAALPIARAQAALVAAVETSGECNTAAVYAALAAYRAALEAQK